MQEIDTLASGSLAADLMGSFLGGKGKVAVTLSSMAITEHAEKPPFPDFTRSSPSNRRQSIYPIGNERYP